VEPDCGIGVDVALEQMPQAFDAARCLVVAHALLGFVDNAVRVELFAVVVPFPIVCENFCALLHVVSDHGRTGDLCAVFHHKGAHVLRASFVEAQHPHERILTAFCMVSELALVYFNGPAHLAELVLAVVVLEVNMDQVADSLEHVIEVCVAQTRQVEFFEVSIGLQRVKAPCEIVEDDAYDLHQSKAALIEESPFPDANLDISALQACTLKDETVFHFRVNVDNTHCFFAARALPVLW